MKNRLFRREWRIYADSTGQRVREESMLTRKEMKQKARQSLRKHYLMFVTVCVAAAILGTEFSGSLDGIKIESREERSPETTVTGIVGRQPNLSDVVLDALQGNEEESRELSEELKEQAVQNTKEGRGSAALGRSRGVLAGFVNSVTSGSILVTLIAAVNSMVGSAGITVFLFIVLSLLLALGAWVFLFNMYTVVSRRIFLEGRVYEKLTIQRFAFLLRVKRWTKVSLTMALASLYQMLWALTIVGGIIKRYSYFLVPYIAAENPDISPKKAVNLSRKMMHGHKWECFVFELTYWGWDMLGSLTFGLTAIFYSNPYKTAAFSEFYVQMRDLAKEKKIEGCELLNDRYLFEKADGDVIFEAYGDSLASVWEEEEQEPEKLRGVAGFLANVLGITVINRQDERAYEEYRNGQAKYQMIKAAVEGVVYPERLFPIPEAGKRQKLETLRYMRRYSVWSVILLFFAFSFMGWVWEVSLHLITDGVFVNRGVLHGPWLPIYGTGGVMILAVLNKFREKPLVEFLLTIVLCGCVEYFTSWFLEITHNGEKWWDYSGYFLNLNGRICAEGLLVFGLGGMAIVYVAAPLLDDLIRKIPYKILIPVCITLLAVFGADEVYSNRHPNTGKGITDYTGAWIEEQEVRT
ncbi:MULTISPECIES: DUF975 family protein [Blautia]|uniref:DUF975 family protein n=1 Tax=Blautia TaxID=572511 RepID=UPI001FAA1557|nr:MULTISPECIES: DUF975 family protein [Blautia]